MLGSTKYIRGIFKPIAKWQIKAFLAISALTIVISVVMFTQALVQEMIEQEQRIINFYAKTYKQVSDPNTKDFESLLYFLDEITPTITFPVIMTGADDEPIEDFSSYTLNIQLDDKMSLDEQRVFLKNYIEKMTQNYPPIVSTDENGVVIQKFYYTHSDLVDRLRLFPFVALIIISAFVSVGYVAFSSSRRNEQSKVWVGMAREAAHQLGTPLSSLLAWIEILRYSKDDPNAIEDTLNEMSNDVNRLQIITTRFSKIGSMPEKEHLDLAKLIEEVSRYFEKRLPHLGRKVEIIRSFDKEIFVDVNSDLIAWVFENLLKNAAESMEEKSGTITIDCRTIPGKRVVVYVTDTGKGMTAKLRRQVFFPGFTTKKRGWGLGLSLAKRIIEEYHHGKIYVKDTTIGKGTTFGVEIPISDLHSGKNHNV